MQLTCLKRTCGNGEHTEEAEVYHERQFLSRCGIHAVNALLKRRAYTARQFDALADSLLTSGYWLCFHPHRSWFRIGNYDVNVLMCALERGGLDVQWLPSRTDFRELLRGEALDGFLVNVPSHWPPWPFSLVFAQRRHWIAVSRYGDRFYVVDSSARCPFLLEDDDALVEYFANVKNENGHVLSVEKKKAISSPG